MKTKIDLGTAVFIGYYVTFTMGVLVGMFFGPDKNFICK